MKSKKFFVLTIGALLLNMAFVCGNPTDTVQLIKHPWTIRLSFSPYCHWSSDFHVRNGDFEKLAQDHRFNFSIDASYTFKKYFEFGLSVGILDYSHLYALKVDTLSANDVQYDDIISKRVPAFTFSTYFHFHILPIFLHTTDTRWNLYLLAKYGGCVLPDLEYGNITDFFNTSKYRQEYGVGIGIAYYFKRRAGLFGELSVGNFSFFPRYATSNVNFRFGIAAKF